ncbi:MAG: endonuclease III domain-containing protein [Desulfobacteraceae bacterium]|nr:MAG: endonuclease III domain-containing protein [Desulfobacteraceae bacterium]
MSIRIELIEMFELLSSRFGPQRWWPAESQLEVMVGAILTQNTNWKNVEKAIKALSEKKLLSLKGINDIPLHELAVIIKPAGYYNIKAGRLKNLITFIVERYESDLKKFFSQDISRLREELLSIKGIGPETADSILLYGGGHPIFVVDAYTFRILSRHGMCDESASYHELQELFMDNLPRDASLFNELHALIVRTAKNYCTKTPDCANCPLADWGRCRPA